MDAGIYSNCVEQDGNNNNNNNGEQGGQEFDLQEASECARLDVDEEAAQYYAYNNANGQQQQQQGQYNYDGQQQYNQQANQGEGFFVGPTCSNNGKAIYLGVFMDETCSYKAPEGTYEKFNYGRMLPYSSNSIVGQDCISCLEVDNDNNKILTSKIYKRVLNLYLIIQHP